MLLTIILSIFATIFAFVSGLSKAITDLSEEEKLKGNPKYWHKRPSSVNKWKNGDKKQGEKFWLSSAQLVWLTDAWHLFGLIERIGFIVTYGCVGYLISTSLWFFFGIAFYPLSMLIFHLFYNSKILRK